MKKSDQQSFLYIILVIILFLPNNLFAEDASFATSALIDRQKKDEGKQVAMKFLQALPAAYKITVSTPQIEDNGNDTANIRFKVNLKLDFSIAPDEKQESYLGANYNHISRIPGVDFNELWSAGFVVASEYPYSPPSIERNPVFLRCNENKCKQIMNFVCQELTSKPLFLYMTAGQQHNVKSQLSFSHCRGLMTKIGFLSIIDREFIIKNVPLPELKDISKVQAKVLYLERSAFPKDDPDFMITR